MPFESIQQERWGHTKSGMKALGGAAKVAEWDAASKGKNLPRKVNHKKGLRHGMMPKK